MTIPKPRDADAHSSIPQFVELLESAIERVDRHPEDAVSLRDAYITRMAISLEERVNSAFSLRWYVEQNWDRLATAYGRAPLLGVLISQLVESKVMEFLNVDDVEVARWLSLSAAFDAVTALAWPETAESRAARWAIERDLRNLRLADREYRWLNDIDTDD